MSSFYPNHLSKDPMSKYILRYGGLGLLHMSFEGDNLDHTEILVFSRYFYFCFSVEYPSPGFLFL